MQRIGSSGPGYAWSPAEPNTIALTLKDQQGVYQIYRLNIVTHKTLCLTCTQVKGGPAVGLNKGSPVFDPSGRYLLMDVEMAHHPYGHKLATASSGWFQDIWALDVKARTWWNLTSYPSSGVHGALIPRVSRDGKQLAWAELYKAPPGRLSLGYALGLATKGPLFGYWRLAIADLLIDKHGVRLAHITHMQPGHADFYETQGWSPNGKEVLFASDIGLASPLTLNLWILDVGTGKATALTHDKAGWNELATFSNDGKWIFYMSSRCCKYDPNNADTAKALHTELYMTSLNGSRTIQLTYFNESGHHESQKGGGIVNKPAFNADGTELAFTEVPSASVTGRSEQSASPSLWVLTFDGSCGGAEPRA